MCYHQPALRLSEVQSAKHASNTLLLCVVYRPRKRSRMCYHQPTLRLKCTTAFRMCSKPTLTDMIFVRAFLRLMFLGPEFFAKSVALIANVRQKCVNALNDLIGDIFHKKIKDSTTNCVKNAEQFMQNVMILPRIKHFA